MMQFPDGAGLLWIEGEPPHTGHAKAVDEEGIEVQVPNLAISQRENPSFSCGHRRFSEGRPKTVASRCCAK